MAWIKQGNLRGPRGEDGGGGTGAPVEQADGDYNLETIHNTTFHGFRFDPDTGRLVVEQSAGDTPVSLPMEGIQRPKDFVNWVFTKRALNFSWNSDELSHLLMEVS